MPVLMDDIATAGKVEHIRKGIKNCARMEKEKKISSGPKKTKYMIIITGREEEEINETVKARRIQRTDKCKYLGMTIATDGQLTDHIKELNSRCDIINREMSAIGAKTQVGKEEEIRVKLKLFETCLILALLYGMEAWKKLSKAEIQNVQKNQGKALKRIFSLPIKTPYIGLIRQTGVWPAEQRIIYSSLMLYHNITNSNKDRLVKKIIQEQRA